jgi:hypothetical protein
MIGSLFKLHAATDVASRLSGKASRIDHIIRVSSARSRVAFTALAVSCAIMTLATACSSRESATAPVRSIQPVGPISASLDPAAEEDLCNADPWFSSCHSWTGLMYSDEYYACPNGCYTFSFMATPSWRTKIQDVLNSIPTSGTCGLLRAYAWHAWSDGRMRYYHPDDGNYGDTHPSKPWNSDGLPDDHAMIHLKVATVQGSTLELARTIVHEAWHAYFNSDDNVAAEGTAQACFP